MDLGADPSKTSQTLNTSSKSGLGYILFESLKKYNRRILQYLADTDEVDTYGQVLKRSIRTAVRLKEKGITKDDIISSCTHNHKNTIIPFIASLFLGIKTAQFDPKLSHLDTVHLLKLIKPRVMFVALESLPFMEKCLKESDVNTELVVFGENEKYSNFSEYLKPNSEEDNFQPVGIDNIKETAVIMFSSGTTGLPKGICLNHHGLFGHNSNQDMTFKNNNDNDRSVTLVYTTLYWISAVSYLLTCIIDGGARVVCSEFNGANAWRVIEKYKVSSIFVAPYLARELLRARQKDVDTSSLKMFVAGGSPVTVELMKDLREAFPSAKIMQGYAQTEATGLIAFFNPGNPKEVELQNKKPLSCGRVLPHYRWKIVDPVTEEQVLGPNQRGEFRYKSDFQMNGYYKIDSSPAYDPEGYIKSGDIVYYDEENCFYVVDRIKEMFKYKGWHILPAVLEGALLSHSAVKEAAVIGIPHELDGEHPMGIVVLNKGYEDVSPENIESYVEQIVPDVQRLRAGVKFVKEIAKTTTGKVKRKTMRRTVLNGEI